VLFLLYRKFVLCGAKFGEAKLREAQLDKVPYMIIVGQREVDAGEISVRSRDRGDLGSMPVSQFMESLQRG